MFDFAWSEIAVIGVVALVAIGPKDMPRAIKTVSDLIKKGRRMASEFQGHMDEMVREANLHEVRDQVNELRSFNVRGQLAKLVDGDGTLRRTLAEDPFRPASGAVPVSAETGYGPGTIEAAYTPAPAGPPMPAFIPPGTLPPPPPPPPRATPPAFIPPDAAIVAPLLRADHGA